MREVGNFLISIFKVGFQIIGGIVFLFVAIFILRVAFFAFFAYLFISMFLAIITGNPEKYLDTWNE